MTEIQLGSGSSSAATHRLTQSSKTLNRRYVEYPSNLAIEEAAMAVSREDSTDAIAPTRPSRLVNLRVHAADLLESQQEESIVPPEDTEAAYTPIIPNVVEFGSANNTTDLSQIVPPEETVEEYAQEYTQVYIQAESYVPAVMENHSPAMIQPEPQELAMSIAADYAAASFDASANNVSAESGSIDTIARAASEAIAAIRTASDPSEIAEQVASLKAFANNIKASSSAPEMMELSDTIEKFVDVAMKSTRVQEEVERKLIEEEAAKAKAQAKAKTEVKSTVKRPAATPKVTTARKPATKVARSRAIAATTRPAAKSVTRRTAKKATPHLVADEDQALRKALRSVASIDDEPSEQTLRKKLPKRKTSKKRFALAFFCAIACVGVIVYFVGSNIPDISVKVAAIQTGIEASYPSYVPRDFSLSDISSENGKITLSFKGPEKATFTITEEKSSWDSTALLRNFVEPTWQNNYITTHEQGLTIYISGASATWVNGGVLYKITAPTNSLTKKQLRNIVTSM